MTMPKPLDIFALLQRGGEMTAAEEKQLLEEMQEAKLTELSGAIKSRNWDQPVKVVNAQGKPPMVVGGYFTQEKFINDKTPSEMEAVLGIFGKLPAGAFVMQFVAPLRKGDFEAKAYSYLPDGKLYTFDPNEKSYLPGRGATQFRLTSQVQATCIAKVLPGQKFEIRNAKH
jgi:hypothetical protein